VPRSKEADERAAIGEGDGAVPVLVQTDEALEPAVVATASRPAAPSEPPVVSVPAKSAALTVVAVGTRDASANVLLASVQAFESTLITSPMTAAGFLFVEL
jgi:hypothetical protein